MVGKNLLIHLLLIVVIGCSNQPDTNRHFNVLKYNAPSNPDFQVSLEQIASISFKTDALSRTVSSHITIDANENIYIFDYKTKDINKFSTTGSRFRFSNSDLKTIDSQLIYASLKYIRKDNSLYLFDDIKANYYRFDLEGQLISCGTTKQGIVRKLVETDEFYYTHFEKNKVIEYTSCKLSYLIRTDKEFNSLDTISISNTDENSSLKDRLLNSTYFLPLPNNEIYIPINSHKFYRIHHLNEKLHLKSIITKKFQPTHRTQAEKNMIFQAIYGTLSRDEDISLKKAIKRDLMIDSKERIWVSPSIDRDKLPNQGTYIDLFKDDIYINRLYFPNIWRYNPYFIVNDKFYLINTKTNSLQIFRIIDEQ